jgi:predicted ester cyclase
MSSDETRAVVQRFYADIWNRQDKSAIPALLCHDFTFRGSLGDVKSGHSGFLSYLEHVHAILGDFRCDIIDLVTEPPKAFARMRFSGLQRGRLFGFDPTGRPVEWAGAALFTFSGTRIRDLWVLGDVHGLIELLRHHAQV